MQLIYDAKCSICRNLAQKIHLLSEQEVEIQALSDPRAQATLDGFYPDGWEHDFYVVDGDRCRRGARALPRLTGALGARKMASVLAEFGVRKLTPQPQCANGNGVTRSKRQLLKAAALSPVVLGLSKITPEDPFKAQVPGFQVHIAEVESLGGGSFRAKAYRCDDCFRAPKASQPLAQGAEAHIIDQAVLRGPSDEETRGESRAAGSMRVKRVRFEKSRPVNGGGVERSVRTAYSLLADHERFGIAGNFGRSDAVTSFAGMVHHDLPMTVLDWVVFKSGDFDAATLFAAQAEGIAALARLHERSGRGEMADLYRQMAPSFLAARRPFTDAVGEPLLTQTNELLITAMPEALRFVQLPDALKPKAITGQAVAAAGCDCSCSCNVCCGCGCGIGICFTNIPCFCDCCISCGCGCGCCVF